MAAWFNFHFQESHLSGKWGSHSPRISKWRPCLHAALYYGCCTTAQHFTTPVIYNRQSHMHRWPPLQLICSFLEFQTWIMGPNSPDLWGTQSTISTCLSLHPCCVPRFFCLTQKCLSMAAQFPCPDGWGLQRILLRGHTWPPCCRLYTSAVQGGNKVFFYHRIDHMMATFIIIIIILYKAPQGFCSA